MPAASRTLPSRNGRGADARSQKRPDFAGQRNRPHRHGCQDDPLSSSRGRRVYLRMLRSFPCSIAPKSSEEGDSPLQSCCGEKRAMVSSLYSIVAVCKNMGIGKDGRLPWPPLRNEYKHFQKMTMTTKEEGKQNVVIMGRKTWFSIPEKHRPLKNRINVVLSKELKDVPEGAHYLAKSLEEALDHLETPEMKRKVDKVWIIGGSSVYKVLTWSESLLFIAMLKIALQAAMEKPIHQHLFVTRILHDFESDTFFPEIDLKKYRLLPNYTGISVDIQEENGIQYKFEVYENII